MMAVMIGIKVFIGILCIFVLMKSLKESAKAHVESKRQSDDRAAVLANAFSIQRRAFRFMSLACVTLVAMVVIMVIW